MSQRLRFEHKLRDLKTVDHILYGCLLYLFLLGAQSTYGQAEVVVVNDHPTSINVSGQSYYLEDPDGSIDPALILSGQYDNQFIRNESEDYSFGNVHTSYWHRISINDDDPTDQSWYLVVDNHHIDSVNFYVPDTLGGYHVDKSGRLVPYDDRSVEFNRFAFEIPSFSGKKDIYIRVTSYFLNYPLKIMRRDAFKKEHAKRRFIFGIMLGFLAMIGLYNLFIYFTVRDYKYLFYILYVFLTIIKISDTHGNLDPLWQGGLSFMRSQSPGMTVFNGISVMLFTYYFLDFKKYIPGAIKYLLFFFVPTWIFSLICNVLDVKLYSSIANQVASVFGVFFILISAVMVYRNGYKPARFYIIAQLFLFFSIFSYAAASLGLFHFGAWTDYMIEFGAGLEILFFSFALADMINVYKKEKQDAEDELVLSLQENQKLIKNQNRILEKKVKERTKDLEVEREKSEKLLLNILPSQVAEELKLNGKTKAKHFTTSTIMFTDFVNFTGISADMDPIDLVAEVNKSFTAFDEIIGQFNLEKIKTIGDAYLAVGGLPTEDPKHAENVLNAAFAIRRYIDEHNKKGGLFEIRIGIHTGPIVAGVVGVKKFAFDIWGDSVNIASRMQDASENGKINISQTTYELVKDMCNTVPRGKIPIKNRGEVHMYFAEPQH